jgi:hypothetical protein
LKTPRALFVYATHRTAEDYANTVQYNEESIENQVYWDTTNNSDWIDTQTMIMPVSPNYVPVDLRVQLALTENDNDERPIVIRVEIPGAPEFFYEEVMVKENIRDMASVLNITLQDIPVNTQELKITLFSPQPFDPIYQTGVHGGDSVAFLGAAASFECRLPGNP